MDRSTWKPNYKITNQMVNDITIIEAARTIVENVGLPVNAIANLSQQTKIRATHYSTRIEGNRLTLAEAEEAIRSRHKVFHGRKRDVIEVRNYWDALTYVEELASKNLPFTENNIQRIAGIVVNGKRNGTLPYRTGQNVIRESESGGIVYMPPEAHDVPILMKELINWLNRSVNEKVPAAIMAGLAHYQFVTIHPYYDGNGRTARLLSTLILHRLGYGLGGIFSLEEYHSKDIQSYYDSLDIGNHHNYYMGRAQADITPWLEYFTAILAQVFEAAKNEALNYKNNPVQLDMTQLLDHRAKIVYSLFSNREFITTANVADTLGLSERMSRILIDGWVKDGWLIIIDASRRSRKYALNKSA